MEHLSNRAARGIALAALTLACVVGPAPQVVEAFERVYAVAVMDQRTRRRSRDRVRGPRLGPRAPRERRPMPARP